MSNDGKPCHAINSLANISLKTLESLKQQGQSRLYIYGATRDIKEQESEKGTEFDLYDIDDLIQIKAKIEEIKKGITVPPLQDKHRQKKIYAQIVRSLSENSEYDWLAAADSTRENYEKATLKSWDDYVRENADRDLSYAGVESRNLLGLLRGRAVCAGNVEIIRNLVAEYGIKATGVIGPAHEWSQVQLDGEWYDDDFTNYQIYLADGRIEKCTRFLNGTVDGKSEFANKGYKAINKMHQVGRKWSMADKKF